jgi:hypothetical protein
MVHECGMNAPFMLSFVAGFGDTIMVFLFIPGNGKERAWQKKIKSK